MKIHKTKFCPQSHSDSPFNPVFVLKTISYIYNIIIIIIFFLLFWPSVKCTHTFLIFNYKIFRLSWNQSINEQPEAKDVEQSLNRIVHQKDQIDRWSWCYSLLYSVDIHTQTLGLTRTMNAIISNKDSTQKLLRSRKQARTLWSQ